MKNNINYIDKLTKNKLKGFQVMPETKWSTFKSDYFDKLATHENLRFHLSDYISIKNTLYTVAGISILTTGILLHNNQNNHMNGLIPITKNVTNEKIFSPAAQNNTYYTDVNSTKDSTLIQEKNNNDVVIRVEVPIIKNVEIRKEVIIKDTIK